MGLEENILSHRWDTFPEGHPNVPMEKAHTYKACVHTHVQTHLRDET